MIRELDRDIKEWLSLYLDEKIPLKDFLDHFGDLPASEFFSSYNFVLSEIEKEIKKEIIREPIDSRFEILDL